MIENILIYKTTNELKQIAIVDGVLKLMILTTTNIPIEKLLEAELITNDSINITMQEILHKLCIYDISELEHLETDTDDIYHVPNKLLLINECDGGYKYNNETKEFTVKINLGSPRLPDKDTVDYKLDYQYCINYSGSNLFIGNINHNIKILKYGKEIL